MSNFTDFFPAAAGGGGGGVNKTFMTIGSTTIVTSTFSPSNNDLSVGDKIYVWLMGGGSGGSAWGYNTTTAATKIGGIGGLFWSGYYTLTSTNDITCSTGVGGAGSTLYVPYNTNSGLDLGASGTNSTLTQGGSIVLSSDNSTLFGFGSFPTSGVSNSPTSYYFYQDPFAFTASGYTTPAYTSTVYGVQGSGGGGFGNAWPSAITGNRTAVTGQGLGGSVIIKW